MMKNKSVYFLGIGVLALLLRTPSFLTAFVNIDENEYALAAKIILEGGVPYRDFLIYQPPFIYYFYALIFKLYSHVEIAQQMFFVHYVLIGWVILTCAAIYKLVQLLFADTKKALLGSFFYAVFSTTFIPQDMLGVNMEILLVLPLTLGLYFFLKAERSDRIRDYLLAGFFASFSFLTKYQGGILLGVFFLYLLLIKPLYLRRWSALSSLPRLLCVFFGFTVPIGFFIGYLVWRGAWDDTLRCFNYILLYAKGPPQSDWVYVIFKFIFRTALIALPNICFWGFAFLSGIRRFQDLASHPGEQSRLPFLFLLSFAVLGFVPILIGGRLYFHYYLILYPVLSVLAADASSEFIQKLSNLSFERAAWRLCVFVLAICIPVTIFTGYSIHKPFREKWKKDFWIYVVDYLRKEASSQDSLFVWGYCPQIYTASNLPMATRFTTADYLTGRMPKTSGLEYNLKDPHPPSVWKKLITDLTTPKEVVEDDTSATIFPGSWNLLVQDFARKAPTWIVDTSPSNYRMYGRYPLSKYLLLHQYLKKHYIRTVQIHGMDVYKRRGSG